jgi:hypothetical protein
MDGRSDPLPPEKNTAHTDDAQDSDDDSTSHSETDEHVDVFEDGELAFTEVDAEEAALRELNFNEVRTYSRCWLNV